jgi:UDP-N-acetylglucosamine 3-dehydrogenase
LLKAGVIGIGNMGRHHARNYYELGILCCVCDHDNKLGQELSNKFSCKFYKDYKEMIAKENLDLVSIAVPNFLHKEIALFCIKNNINCIIEKPLAGNLEDANEIINASNKSKAIVTVGHIERFNPVVKQLKKIIDSKEIGDITSIHATRVGLFPSQIKDANVIIDLGVHDIDICSYLLGKQPDHVLCYHGKALSKRIDYAEIFLKYNGANAIIQTNWITPIKIRSIAITGTKGYIEANYVTQQIIFYKSNVEKNFDNFGDFVIKFGEPKKEIINVSKEEPLKEELKSFIESITLKKRPVVTLDEAYSALKIAIEASETK